MSAYLVTGATGFVGGALTLELLEQTRAPIHLLVRGSAAEATDRCLSVLRVAAELYGRGADFIDLHRGRLHVHAGDLACDVAAGQLAAHEITDVWHCAASLKFEDRSRLEIFAVNVDGTTRLLDLAEQLGVERFNYISTAYVAGSMMGRISESPAPTDTTPNNQYELSKRIAESHVLQRDSMHARIWRPSIVVGHSTTFAAVSAAGLYGLIQDACRFRWRVGAIFGPKFVMRQRRMMADPAAQINLVPVDLLARQAVSLSLHPTFDARIIHLTNGSAPVMRDLMSIMSAMTGIPEPEYVGSTTGFTPIEQRFHRTMQFYAPHVVGTKAFAQDVAQRYGAAIDFPMSPDHLHSMIAWYLDHTGLTREVGVA
ncbi:SDR family oxidoreductase [Nocardia brasiliensis]|uniref:SDR family oxidoreductase n=1 Tax=Nocardia brasiliensis TaxID=37326 RepID=UPI003D8DE362